MSSGAFAKQISRISVEADWLHYRKQPAFKIGFLQGYNDQCDWHHSSISLDEALDLQYLIGRAIDEATKGDAP